MSNTSLHKFLEAVSDMASERCGQVFTDQMTNLLAERDRLFKNSWRDIDATTLSDDERKKLLREVDFDTMTSHAGQFLDSASYPNFLFQVAQTALKFGELEKASRLFIAIVTKHARFCEDFLLARIHINLSKIAYQQNNFDLAQQELKTSLRLFEKIKDTKGIISVQNRLATILIDQGKLEEGKKYLLEALEAAQNAKLNTTLASIHVNLGNVANILGKWNDAIDHFKNALQILGKDTNDSLRASLNLNLANVHMQQGNFPKAEAQIKESNLYSDRSNLRHQRGLSYLVQSEIACRKRDYSAANALVVTAFHIFSEMGDRLRVADVYRVLGMISRDSGHPEQAESYFENSRRINTDLSNPLNLGETLFELGQLYKTAGENAKATDVFREAITNFKRMNAVSRMLETEIALSTL
ncbi:MAG: hypothetical protein AUJ47_11110 [Candidatus Marinimicrobia bacterium CG1_02_48_14]|nr:MAG: hypothetical protein AUJ47_11110 [Candidatus Marinimicrobia bacterium CG1_02_48_14]